MSLGILNAWPVVVFWLASVHVPSIQSRPERMALSANGIKEQLSYAYVHAIASRCGFTLVRPQTDIDSVDVEIHGHGYLVAESTYQSPSVHLQLKATSMKVAGSGTKKLTKGGMAAPDDVYPFELDIKNYNELRGVHFTPRLLVALFLPPRNDHWLSHSEAGLISRRCAYWCSLRELPDVPNVNSKTVYIPKANVFNCASLSSIMIGLSKGNLP